jgi:hypothetical protein
MVANGIRLTKRCNALSSRSAVTRGLPDLGKSFTLLVCESAGLKSRRVIKRPMLVDRHRRSRLAWCLARRGWNLRTWRKIHWSDESRFLLQVLFEYGTGCEWHQSNQTLQCPVVMIRCYPLSAGSWQVFHIVGLCVFSHQSADYSIVVAHLTSNCLDLSQGESLNVHCWQTDIDEHVWHGV